MITFHVKLEANMDFLTIYDGVGHQKKVMNVLTGKLNFTSSIVYNNKMTVIFKTNSETTAFGFKAEIQYGMFKLPHGK